jgi:beta-glucosidase
MKYYLASLILVASALGQQARQPFQDPNLPVEQRIDNLLSLMTVDEKIACLSTRTAVPRLGVPNIGSSEGIHGLVQRQGRGGAVTTTQFPQPPGLGATWDPDLVRQAAGVEGYEARFLSQTAKYGRQALQLWGPQADLARDPRWGRSEEVYGEDPFLNGTMAASFVKGLQGDNPKYWQSAALLKHFLANSNEDHRNVSTSDFDERLFWEYYSVPFRMGFVEGGATGVMASYNAWNGTPMTVHPVLRSVLREKWGVEIISTDAGASRFLSVPRKIYPDHKASVIACIKAGINQFLDPYAPEAKAAFDEKSLTMADFDGLLRPKFRTVIRLGLLDPPEMVPYSSIKDSPEPWTTEKHKAISLKAALESIVLLKNEKNFLPLDKKTLKSVAVIGPLADAVHWDWYGGTPPYAITPLQGIKEALGPGVAVTEVLAQSGSAAMAAAKKADVAIVIVGNDPKCGPNMGSEWYSDPVEGNGFTLPCTVPSEGREGRDRETIDLYQEQLVKQVYIANQKTVVVLVSSYPFAINWTQANIPAILQMAHSSQDEGTAIAKALFGEYNPGGRLVVTWPKSLTQLPPMMDYNIRHGRTYMYFKEAPLYPFGFGLSYTTFRLSNLKTSAPRLPKDGSLKVSVDVTNTGTRAGDEVVQVYVKHPSSKVERPRQQLAGFQRVTVQPGETKTVEIPLQASRLAYWDASRKALTVEPEPVNIVVGNSSANTPLSATVRVE